MKIRGRTYRVTVLGQASIFLLVGLLFFGGVTACSVIYNHLFLSDKEAADTNKKENTANGEDLDDTEDVLPVVAAGQGIHIDGQEEGNSQDRMDASDEQDMSRIPEGRKVKMIDSAPDLGVLVLVNKTNAISSDYEPHVLVQVSDYVPGKDEAYSYGRPELVNAFDLMQMDAKKEGLQIVVSNAYRSYAVQEFTFAGNVKQKGSVEAANKTSAKPGESEHQTGLAMDLTTESLGYAVTTRFEETPEGVWVREHCHEYGFIIRFPKGKENITGYSYEPWHIRYVGRNAAKVIYENGWTLEEYLESKQTSGNV